MLCLVVFVGEADVGAADVQAEGDGAALRLLPCLLSAECGQVEVGNAVVERLNATAECAECGDFVIWRWGHGNERRVADVQLPQPGGNLVGGGGAARAVSHSSHDTTSGRFSIIVIFGLLFYDNLRTSSRTDVSSGGGAEVVVASGLDPRPLGGRAAVQRKLAPFAPQGCGQPSGESSQNSCQPYTVRSSNPYDGTITSSPLPLVQ